MKLIYLNIVSVGLVLSGCGSSSIEIPFEGDYLQVDTSCGATVEQVRERPLAASAANTYFSFRDGKYRVVTDFGLGCEIASQYTISNLTEFEFYYDKPEHVALSDEPFCKETAKVLNNTFRDTAKGPFVTQYEYEDPVLELRNPSSGECLIFRRK